MKRATDHQRAQRVIRKMERLGFDVRGEPTISDTEPQQQNLFHKTEKFTHDFIFVDGSGDRVRVYFPYEEESGQGMDITTRAVYIRTLYFRGKGRGKGQEEVFSPFWRSIREFEQNIREFIKQNRGY